MSPKRATSSTVVTRACPIGFAVLLAVGAAFASAATAREFRYCEKPGGPGAYLAASPNVSCATAKAVMRTIVARCFNRTRCIANGFRCVAYWSGGFDRTFDYTHHALCNDRWRWIDWDGG